MKRNLKYILLIIILFFILIFFLSYNKTQEGFLDTNHEKTIYLVWRNKIKDSGTHHGFGDKLRGAIFLYQYCKKHKINFKIDATDDICGDFLKNVHSPDYNIIKNEKIIIFENKSVQEINKTIERTFNNMNTIYLYTNAWPNNLNDDDKTFAKYICEPKDSINAEVNKKIKDLPKEFGIQHFRFKDDVFKNDLTIENKLFEKYFNLLFETTIDTDVLFSNSNNFKKYSKEQLNIKTVDCNDVLCKIDHVGYSTDRESIKNTFIEFFILSKAIYIKSYTCYNWPSNFVHWPVKIYDIPFKNVYIDEKKL